MTNVILSEWIKFRTVRSTWWAVAALAALPIAVALLVALTGSLEPDDTVLTGALGNAAVGLVPAGILGVLVAAGEDGGHTVRPTFAATPRRWPVAVAKAVLTGGVVFVVAAIANTVGLLVARALLPDHDPGSTGPLLALTLIYVSMAVLGVALGIALRSTAGAVTAVTAVLLAPALLGPLLGRAQWLATVTPLPAAQRVLLPDAAVPGGPDAWPSVALVGLGCLASLTAAIGLLLRRDL